MHVYGWMMNVLMCITDCSSIGTVNKSISNELSFFRRSADEDQGNSGVRSETKRQIPVLDKEKNITFLLKELDSLRDLNKKVKRHGLRGDSVSHFFDIKLVSHLGTCISTTQHMSRATIGLAGHLQVMWNL